MIPPDPIASDRPQSSEKRFVFSLGIAVLAIGLWLTSRHSYLLFHAAVEMFAAAVAFAAFVVAWNSRRFSQNGYLLLLGIGLLPVGVLDLVHALAYKGMGVFHGHGANLPTQLWIAARGVQAVALVLALRYVRRSVSAWPALAGALGVAALLLTLIFPTATFPVCYAESGPQPGLTPFKIGAEYAICTALLAALGGLWHNRTRFSRDTYRLLAVGIGVTILAELAFTRYVSVYGDFNCLGHLLKAVAALFFYKAIVEATLRDPYQGLFQDLRQREQDIRRLNASLEDRVRERTAQLETANRELEAFCYSVSHDLRTPLRTINGFSHAALEDYGERLDETGRDYLHRIRAGCLQMGRLIDDLLRLSRVTRDPMRHGPVDLTALAQVIAGELRAQSPGRVVDVRIEPGLTAVGDARLLRAALANLLENAWKFSAGRPDAVIEVGAEGGSRQSAVGSLPNGAGQDADPETHTESGVPRPASLPVFYVRDNGVGFDMRYAGKLFNAFQRLHAAHEFAGTGIGLATAARVIRRHGGRIWADATVGRGATFYFTLESEPANPAQ